MITQVQLKLFPDRICRPRPEWAYCLYAALLKLAPSNFADLLHEDAVTPVSQYLTVCGESLLWTVSLLGETSEQILGPILAQSDGFYLDQQQIHLRMTARRVRSIPDTETLLRQASAYDDTYRLHIHTPAAFKSQKRYVNLPSAHLILQNLHRKWNRCFPNIPLMTDAEEEVLSSALRCHDFQLTDQDYHLKGHAIPGFTGTLTLEHHLSGIQKKRADILLLFSQYAGIGIKTTLGMGGVTLDRPCQTAAKQHQ